MIIEEIPGYEGLANVLRAAYNQAAVGKGHERHANGRAFEDQPMQTISDLFNSPHGMTFQIAKKLEEGIRMPEFERQERELLGAIVYTAGLIIWLRRQRDLRNKIEVAHSMMDDTLAATFGIGAVIKSKERGQ